LKSTVEIGNDKWQVALSDEKQLSFAYAIPKELSTWKNSPLWRSWDINDTSDLEEEWSYEFEGLPTTFSPFQLKKRLLNALVDLIQRSKTDFFYFTPTTTKRGRIFSNLGPDLIALLGRGWRLQLDDHWFYFSKQ
jgi:hypothetical protein